MAQDPVLQREMFNTRGRSAKGSGITSMVDDGSSGMTREERLQIAKAMLAEAQMKQNPEYYFNTLAQGDRPAMTRPVASSAPPPAMQQMPAAQQMAQMQAAGVRPVGMADGGEVRKGFQEGGINNVVNPYRSRTFGEIGYDMFNSIFPIDDRIYTPPNSVDDPDRPKDAPLLYGFSSEEEREKALSTPGKAGSYLEGLGSLSDEEYAKFDARVKAEDARKAKEEENRGKGLQPGLSAPYPAASNVSSPENVPKKVEDTDRKQTALESIKAEREAQKNQNFNMALMQAGLAMMAGKSPNALQNIAEGGISGLAAYTGLEKSDRETALAERKLGAYEDSLRRSEDYNIARAEALREKSVTARQNIAVRALGLAQKQLEQEIASDPTLGMDKSKRENRLLQITDQFMRDLSLDQQFGGGSAEDTLERGVDPEIAAAF